MAETQSPVTYTVLVMSGGGTSDGAAVRRQQPAEGVATTWKWVQQNTLDGVDALIARRLQTAKFVQVTRTPLALPTRPLLTVMASAPPPQRGWSDRTFYVMDADTVHASQPTRHEVEFAYKPRARRLVFTITAAVRRSLGTATHVHVAYADDFDLDLLRQLKARLAEATRAPLVVDLWSPGNLPAFSGSSDLNVRQQQAFTAMTFGGPWLIWGPPGTGKTKVIVDAVSHALKRGRSVLITSHTNVAVDNVVESVVETVDKPGSVIRVGGRSGGLTRTVSEHPWLTVDKAAAALTNRVEKLETIAAALNENASHPDRTHLELIIEKLEQGRGARVETALRAREAADLAGSLAQDISVAESEHARFQAHIAELDRSAVRETDYASDLADLTAHFQLASRSSEECSLQLAVTEQTLASLHVAHSNAVVEWSNATSARQTWASGLPWRRRRTEDRVRRAAEVRDALANEIAAAGARRADARELVSRVSANASTLSAQIKVRKEALARARALKAQKDELVKADAARAHATRRLRDQYETVATAADAVPDRDSTIAEALADGTLDALTDREIYNERVAALETAARELDGRKKLLDDEYAATKKLLLEEAPIVACTLATLGGNSQLSNRRFDTVIVDEAASAQIGDLVYAGSKADRSLAYVGDFLQNAPITDTDDAITERDRRILPWQKDDIFRLLGVTNRASAETNSRCVALNTQFRYPPILADLVNEFCYDGLLESSWSNPGGTAESPYAIFVDTSAHPAQGLRRDGTSWVHPLGLDLIEAIYASHRGDSQVSMGMVSPYAAHASRAGSLARRKNINIECGTAHKFQGRQYGVVILDLMQGSEGLRWAAMADLSGNEREVSAAKLLNVGITRAQQRLYIIGDWSVVRRTESPGMVAIANLLGRPDFALVTAAEVLSGDTDDPAARTARTSAETHRF
ncbi:DEAD/DEAH box helicase [Rhodococcoides fascians]|uniref:DEAD/DEAH box helicase n=1 Tax=Rhodococcoides fascians TaxID=1828 RepID=UPI00056876FF|nr:AAA domain-containing protein [Rhodococcus fascians]